jgi:hypothetical protein
VLHSSHFEVYNCNDFDLLIFYSSEVIADILSSSGLMMHDTTVPQKFMVIQRIGCVRGFLSQYQSLSFTNVAVLTSISEYNHNAWCEGILLPKLTFEKLCLHFNCFVYKK